MVKVWPLDETIQCQQLTAEYLQDAVELIEKAFLPYENVCRAVEVAGDPESLMELRELTTATARDGVTVIAVDKTTNKVIGAAFNKLQVRDNSAFEEIAKSWRSDKSKALVQFMVDADAAINLFDHCKVDCLLELMFLGTSPEYRGRGIGKKLTEITIEIGNSLASGTNMKTSVDGSELPLQPTPKIVSSIFTSFITQKIARELEFEIVLEKSFDQLNYKGRKFSDIIGPETPKLTLEYKRLQTII